MLQRAIQTKLYHLNLVRNQATFEFLQNFLDHQHLRMIRITDYDFKCQFHGSDGVCVCVCARVRFRAYAYVLVDMVSVFAYVLCACASNHAHHYLGWLGSCNQGQYAHMCCVRVLLYWGWRGSCNYGQVRESRDLSLGVL